MLKDKPRWLRRAPLRVSIIVFAGLCASLGLIAPGASATPLASHPSVTAAASSSAHLAKAADVIYCSINVDSPHHSTHSPETAGAQAQVTCTGAVTSIRMSIGLYWSGYYLGSKTEQADGKSSLEFGYYLACTNGGWQATATALIKAPPGYSPSSVDITDTKVAKVTC
jgi:hypothetical protein